VIRRYSKRKWVEIYSCRTCGKIIEKAITGNARYNLEEKFQDERYRGKREKYPWGKRKRRKDTVIHTIFGDTVVIPYPFREDRFLKKPKRHWFWEREPR